MHLDRTNIASKNDCENVNTLTHDEDHWVVLAHLRRRWSLSGREGLGSGVFEELKRLISTTPEVEKEMEANGGHRGDRTLNRTRSLVDRTCSVSVQRLRVFQFDDRTRSVSGNYRPDASGRSGSLLDSNRTLALWRPVSSSARPVTVSLCATQA
jgi:hypothetical protein